MDNDKLMIEAKVFEKIKNGLKQVRIKSMDDEIKAMVDSLLYLLENKDSEEIEFTSLEDTIHNKMKTTKDKELNVKLYMLYRKLQDGKISEGEALRLYEIYKRTEYDYKYI
jgi:Ca2+-binding EF-hand superfamily protein